MVSLPYIEKVLQEKFGKEDEVTMAVEALELPDGKAKIVFFVIAKEQKPTIQELNNYLRKRGVANLVAITDVVVVEEIPVL